MDNEFSEGAMLGIILIALSAVIGLSFAVFAIAKEMSNTSVEKINKVSNDLVHAQATDTSTPIPTIAIIATAIVVICLIIFIKRAKKAKHDKIIETLEPINELTCGEKLKLFESKLPENIINKRTKLYLAISELKNNNYYSSMFNEIDKIVEDFSINSVIHNNVSEKSIQEYENILDKYAIYVDKQKELYEQNQANELETMQPMIDEQHEVITNMLELMIKEPLNYMTTESQLYSDVTKEID